MAKEERHRPPRPEANSLRFPPDRAFVVQLAGTDDSRKPSRGRVEHVLTGRSTRFEDLDALAEFFGEVLADEQAGRDRREEE